MATSTDPERLPRSSGRPGDRPVDTSPAQWGLRARINSVLPAPARLPPGPREFASRRDVAAIARGLPVTQSIVVANPYGSAGRTPTTVLLSSLMGKHRGGDVVAWDLSDDDGNLGRRAANNIDAGDTVWRLLADAAGSRIELDAHPGGLSRYLCRQPTGDEMLTLDRSTRSLDSITVDELESIDRLLAEHRQITIIDTNCDDRSVTWRWATHRADQLVIPMPYTREAAAAVTGMVATLTERGLTGLVERAVVIASQPRDGAAPEAVEEARYRVSAAGVSEIVEVPYDPIVASWERLDHLILDTATVRAWTHAAAVVIDTLAAGAASRAPRVWQPLALPAAPASSATPTDLEDPDNRDAEFAKTTAALRNLVSQKALTAAPEPTPEPETPEPETPEPETPEPETPEPTPTQAPGTRPGQAVIGAVGRVPRIAVALVLAAATGLLVWNFAGDAPPQPNPVSQQVQKPAVDPDRASGPAIIEAYDNRYYRDRSAAAAVALWDFGPSTPNQAQQRIDSLQATIDAVDPAMRHRLTITPTSAPTVFDVVLTLTTPDGTDYPYNQRFTVRRSGDVYSIVDKVDCSASCPAI